MSEHAIVLRAVDGKLFMSVFCNRLFGGWLFCFHPVVGRSPLVTERPFIPVYSRDSESKLYKCSYIRLVEDAEDESRFAECCWISMNSERFIFI